MKKLNIILLLLVLFASCKKDDVTPDTDNCPYKHKEVAIGVWDMETTDGVDVAHGLDASKIKEISVIIYSDDANIIWPLNRSESTTNGTSAGGWQINQASKVSLYRLDGGIFDNGSFNSSSNRGIVYIDYIE